MVVLYEWIITNEKVQLRAKVRYELFSWSIKEDSSRDRFDEFRTLSIVSAATSYYRGKVNPLSKLMEIINVLH